MKSSKERPYVLVVAEVIYSEISKIKKENLGFSNIDAVDNFIGSEISKKQCDFSSERLDVFINQLKLF